MSLYNEGGGLAGWLRRIHITWMGLMERLRHDVLYTTRTSTGCEDLDDLTAEVGRAGRFLPRITEEG
jgi:hypothetical protein